jgi:hypothetical protein
VRKEDKIYDCVQLLHEPGDYRKDDSTKNGGAGGPQITRSTREL